MIHNSVGIFVCTKPTWSGAIFLSCGGNAKNRRRFARKLKLDKGFIVTTSKSKRG